MTDRNSILQRVLNLRELGSRTNSEAEAMNAMKAADKLMHAYRIEEAELAMAEATGEIKVEIVSEYQGGIQNGRNRHKVQACLWSIESYCEVEAVLKGASYYNGTGVYEPVVHWIGDKPDVELAVYLVKLVRDALDREYDRWKRTQQGVGRGAKGAFQTAMAHRINQRLRDMRDERNTARTQAVKDAQRLLDVDAAERLGVAVANGIIKELTSTALVVASAAEVKRQEVQAAYNRAYGKTRLGTASGFSYGRNGTAHAAGRAAGNRVGLGRPVTGKAQSRLA
jgi:hypothetical protein